MDDPNSDVIKSRQLRGKLYSAGWKYGEIERLLRFLSNHQPTYEDMEETVFKHLQFLRFLVCTGRIVD